MRLQAAAANTADIFPGISLSVRDNVAWVILEIHRRFWIAFKKHTESKFLSVVKNEFSWKCSLGTEVAPSFICVILLLLLLFDVLLSLVLFFDTRSQSVDQTMPEFVI